MPIRSCLRIVYKTCMEELTEIKEEISLKKSRTRYLLKNNLSLILRGLQKGRARIDRRNITASREADFGIPLL